MFSIAIPLFCFSHYSLSVQSQNTTHSYFKVHPYNLAVALHIIHTRGTQLCASVYQGTEIILLMVLGPVDCLLREEQGNIKSDSILHVLHKINSRWSKDLNVGKK